MKICLTAKKIMQVHFESETLSIRYIDMKSLNFS